MCGIFGYLGHQEAQSLIIDGLTSLAYRGYDSAGIAVLSPEGTWGVHRAAGKIDNLISVAAASPLPGKIGIGHTRWATHGQPTEINAHPHRDGTGSIVVVHNGILENYSDLKERLIANGHVFSSTTDTEVIPHLIQELLADHLSFTEAVRIAAGQLRGAHAIACLHSDLPEEMVILRIGNAGGIAVGHGQNEMFIASDLSALVPHTNYVTPLESGEMAIVRSEGCEIMTLAGKPVDSNKLTITVNTVSAQKNGYKHFMLKEIMEQPETAMSALRGRLAFDPHEVTIEFPFADKSLEDLTRVVFLGMGSSSHAAQIGARYIESLARIPATSENSAEFRYRDPVIDRHTLVVAVAQSGETADTLEAMHMAATAGARTLTITNVEGSQAYRQAEAAILIHAGPEIGVAATKTFINSMIAMQLLALKLATIQKTISVTASAEYVQALSHLPSLLGDAIGATNSVYTRLASKYAQAQRFLFIGRGFMEPIAREGALKLKEISYIHAEGMSAAELKHGPIALVDPETPIVAFAPRNNMYEKMLGNISEVRARSGKVIGITTAGNSGFAEFVDDVLYIPAAPPLIEPLLATIPAQLLAYHIADMLGNDVDQPRNLAKSVTVE